MKAGEKKIIELNNSKIETVVVSVDNDVAILEDTDKNKYKCLFREGSWRVTKN